MPLLRASAFCRSPDSPPPIVRLELYRPPPRPPPEVAADSTYLAHGQSSKKSEESLANPPLVDRPETSRRRVAGENGRHHDDEDNNWGDEESLVAVASLEFLQASRLMAGAVVWVERLPPSSCERREEEEREDGGEGRRHQERSRRRVPARLRLLPAAPLPGSGPSSALAENGGGDDAQHVVYLSPAAAANLGLYNSCQGGSWRGRVFPMSSSCGETSSVSAERRLPEASSAALKVWGKPVRSIEMRDKFWRRRPSSAGRLSSSSSPSSPLGPVVPLPPAGSLLHAGSILSVVSFESEIYFLQVVSVQAVVASEGEAGAALKEGGFSSQVRSVALARATASTQYTIDENPRETTTTGIAGGPIDRQVLPGVCPQLPPLSEALSFLRPDQSSRLSVVPHPDVPRLAERFRLCAGARSLSMCAVSVVGTDRDHHVTAALHEAAAASGRRCVDAGHSWAAFGYLHCGGSSTTTAALAASGALPDKLRGLDAAAEVAVEHAPSVLVLRLDNELSSDRHDRQDQEDRVWSALSRMAQRNIDAWGVAGGVTVVLVSDETLDGGGPLAQRILAAPYASSHPDANYIRRLWNDPWRGLDQECVDLLRGRPAAEIERAFQLCKADGNFRPSDTKSILRLLKHCCEKVDQERRTRSNAQSRIPSVRWEDIGGLCHVRREIVEAIDLPLRYPHLLPEGRANLRTGLLLWGPPGTGKTLVAKAVATECSLPFVSVRGPELMGSYIGESEENVRNVFVSARRLASQNLPPAAVLFFDELDSLAPRRGDRSSGGNVTDRVVATLFAELERRVEGVKVFCMGATNRPDLLDPALLRPGRLDRLIYMGADASDHSRILHAQIRRLRLDGVAKEMASFLAKSLPANLTGADLSTIATASLVRATDRLCTEADGELARRQSEGDAVTLDEVLRSWDEDKLKPLVTLEDLVESANEVVPSVDANEILRYSSLRDSFLSN